MTRLNMRGLLALVLTVLTLGLGQVPASAQVIGRVPYLSSNPCKGVSLSLAFAKSTGANCLGGNKYASASNIPGWTYTGGTPAGTGSYAAKADGSLQFFPSYTNLLLQSQTFDNASWGKTNVTVSANSVEAPDGTTTADTLTAGATDSYMTQATSSLAGITRTFSIYLRTASGTVPMKIGIGASYADITVTTSWQRFTVTNADAVERVIVGGVNSFSTGEAVYAWGAQLELGSTASTYIPTTTAAVTVATPRITDAGYWAEEARTNLLTYSQQFDNAAWTKTGATVSADVITSPDGTATADKISEDTSLGAHRFLASQSKAASATTYTFSAYFKAAERSQMRLAFDDGGSNGASAIFDASNGTISTAAAISGDFTSPSATISPISGGWYRATLTATSNTGTTIRYVVGSALAGSFSYQGVSGYGIYIWGAQLELGSFATSPIPTTSVAVTRAADMGYVPLTGPTDGTMFVEGSHLLPTNPVYLGHDSATSAGLYMASLAGNHWNGALILGPTGTMSFAPSINRLALAYTGTSSRSLSVNGSAVATSATSKRTFNRVMVGQRGDLAGTQSANGPIRRIVIYPRAFGNSELQAATIGPVSFANDNAPEDMKAALWGWVA